MQKTLLFVDKVVLPETPSMFGVNFQVWRTGAALVGMTLLVIGLVWDAD